MATVVDMPTPKSCEACQLYGCFLEETLCPVAGTIEDPYKIHPECFIVGEIPDTHGRLIDADFIISCLEEIKDTYPKTYEIIKGILDKTPTVLEASE